MRSKTNDRDKNFTAGKHLTSHSIALCAGTILLVGGGWLFSYVWHWQNRPHVLEIYCFVPASGGNGGSTVVVFIRTPGGKTVLIDGGQGDAVIHDLTSVMPFYERTIDTLILTDDDDAHAAGLDTVLDRYHVGRVYEMAVPENISASTTDAIASSSAYAAFEKISAAKNVILERVGRGDVMSIGELSADIVFPPESSLNDMSSNMSDKPDPTFKFSKTNGPTLAFSFTYGSTRLFFAGLVTKTEQKYIAEKSAGMASSSPDQTLLILPKGENVASVDEGFFTAVDPGFTDPDFVVVSKKPRSVGVTSPAKSPSLLKPQKSSKPSKPPFDISTVPNVSTINLATDGDVEFISDGATFTEKKLF